jgi:hypothetical protein
MGQILRGVFLWPGNKICDACHVEAGDDRMMIGTLVNMLFWNIAAVLIVVLVW